MKNILNALGLIGGTLLCLPCYADFSGKYECLTGVMSKGKILEGIVTLTKQGQQYATQIIWNDEEDKSALDSGTLKPTTNPKIFIEDWSSNQKEGNLIGMSAWIFQGNNIMIDYLYVNITNGTVHTGEMSCSQKN
jgi:hypothetical protein